MIHICICVLALEGALLIRRGEGDLVLVGGAVRMWAGLHRCMRSWAPRGGTYKKDHSILGSPTNGKYQIQGAITVFSWGFCSCSLRNSRVVTCYSVVHFWAPMMARLYLKLSSPPNSAISWRPLYSETMTIHSFLSSGNIQPSQRGLVLWILQQMPCH